MKRLSHLVIGVRSMLVVVSCVMSMSALAAEPATRPNVLFILTDDMGWGDLSCYGNRELATPNIDRLAREGLRFTQFYVASPICSPSRTAYMTGSYPARFQINDYLHSHAANKAHECADWLDPHVSTLARTLQSSGYATGHFGKWHMGGGRDVQDAPWPKEYGFDEHHVNCEGCGPRIDTYGSATPVPVEGKMLARYEFTQFWSDKAMDFMYRHKSGPFFVQLWPQDVHTPHVPDPEELPSVATTPKPHQNFNAVLRRYDREIGRVLDFLKSEGLEQNTIVIFASDNGPEPSFKRQRAGGLRGMKWSLYEGGIREPFLIRWPAHVPAGKTDDHTVLASIDLYPTLCGLTGIAVPNDASLNGMDASQAMLGNPIDRKNPLFWEYGRQADYLFPKEPFARSPNLAIRDGKWKLLINANGSGGELYDLAIDSNESKNVAEDNPQVKKRLADLVIAWRASLP